MDGLCFVFFTEFLSCCERFFEVFLSLFQSLNKKKIHERITNQYQLKQMYGSEFTNNLYSCYVGTINYMFIVMKNIAL